jgi:tetratricopeptide (TPR) repeat protein
MTRRCAVVSIALCLLSPLSASAGIYNPDEPDEGRLARTPVEVIKEFRDNLWKLRSIRLPEVPHDNPLRRRYILVADLAQKQETGKLSLEQKVALSATYLRRGNAPAALQVLRQLTREDPDNILVLGNLATAYQQVGDLREANDTMRQLKRAWPEQWTDLKEPQQKFLERIGWHQALYEWYHKAELYYAKLVRLRMLEEPKKIQLRDETPDRLFGDDKSPIQFVAENGKWEPGKLAATEKAKLPRDAADIVQQLLIWLPDDHRLYWLLGEIYNAQGTPNDLLAAYKLFDDLVDPQKRQYRPRELVEHFRLLRERVAELPPEGNARMPDLEGMLDKAEAKRDEEAAPFDWRNLFVGAGIGFVVAVFGSWQLREIRRRRQSRAASVRG